jgi:hypothetical protein
MKVTKVDKAVDKVVEKVARKSDQETIEFLEIQLENLRQKFLETLSRWEEAVSESESRAILIADLQRQLAESPRVLIWIRLLESRVRAKTRRLRWSPKRAHKASSRISRSGSTDDNPEKIEATKFPIFIILRDRLEPLLELLRWLESVGQTDIWLIDNDSTYPPLVEYLKMTEYQVVHLGENLGHRSPWISGLVQREARDRFYVVTDPDVIPDSQCPADALQYFETLLTEYPEIHKVGFGLRIDDLPDHYALARSVIEWETRFWKDEISPGLFRAPIDTTFAMYRPLVGHHDNSLAIRTGPPYVAQHEPWYHDTAKPSVEQAFYRDHSDPLFSNWNGETLARWKERWLEENT